MSSKNKWWRWPEHAATGTPPWWIIAGRLIGYPFLIAGAAIYCIGVLIGYGRKEAARCMQGMP